MFRLIIDYIKEAFQFYYNHEVLTSNPQKRGTNHKEDK